MLIGVAVLGWMDVAWGAPPLKVVTATYFGTEGENDLEGAAAGADGTIYVVGNTGALAKELPGGVGAATFGEGMKEAKCGCGFVAHLSGDGKKILGYAQFGPGVTLLTTVVLSGNGVYVSGYGSEGLEGVLKEKAGMMREFPLREEIKAYETEKAAGKEDKIGGRPGLARYGAPCVMKLSADLKKLESGTYLEGWQQVWDKKRVAKPARQMLGGYQEYYWQPTATVVLKSGELLVCHDGGYLRMLTDKDREAAKENPKLLDKLAFYDMCDYVSKLSADLGKRDWKKPIYTPMVNAEVAGKVQEGWKLDHYGSPRTHRMRVDKDENVYLCGWSASYTSKEPWWVPYLFKMDPKSGDVVWKAYEYDPMSGGENRIGGQIADTACVSLAIDEDGNVLSSLLADGGNSVMEWSPKAEKLGAPFEAKTKGGGFPVHLVHWWGQIHRVDAKTRSGLGGARIGAWGWASDVASLPGNSVLAFGRYNWKFDFTADAWWKETAVENPNAFIRVYSPEFDMTFSTPVPGVVPFEIARVGAGRYALVGRAEQGVSPVQDALFAKPVGKTDGYLMILDWAGETK